MRNSTLLAVPGVLDTVRSSPLSAREGFITVEKLAVSRKSQTRRRKSGMVDARSRCLLTDSDMATVSRSGPTVAFREFRSIANTFCNCNTCLCLAAILLPAAWLQLRAPRTAWTHPSFLIWTGRSSKPCGSTSVEDVVGLMIATFVSTGRSGRLFLAAAANGHDCTTGRLISFGIVARCTVMT